MSEVVRKTISIPSSMAEFINSRLETGMFGNESEYFRDLVRADQRRVEAEAQRHAFDAMIEESLASGRTDQSLDEIFAEARQRAKTR